MSMERKAYVCVKGDWIPLDNCEFLDISEDMQGRDLVKFKYEGTEYESYVTNR
jgi:hypothetical protein